MENVTTSHLHSHGSWPAPQGSEQIVPRLGVVNGTQKIVGLGKF